MPFQAQLKFQKQKQSKGWLGLGLGLQGCVEGVWREAQGLEGEEKKKVLKVRAEDAKKMPRAGARNDGRPQFKRACGFVVAG